MSTQVHAEKKRERRRKEGAIGYAILGGEAHEVVVVEAPSPLVGTELLWGFSPRMLSGFETNGAVEVDPLPESSS